MRLFIISCGGYPSSKNYYAGGFVHTRVKKYIEAGHECFVFVPSSVYFSTYVHDGVNVILGDYKTLLLHVRLFKPDFILTHFIDSVTYKFIKETKNPVVMWVHGYGAVAWYRYLYDFKFSKDFLLFLYVNIKNLIRFHKMTKKNIRFVFVSDWMKRIASFDTLSKPGNYAVIPNPIDEKLFSYKTKTAEDRKNILLVRSFNSKKYANDIAIKAILELSKKSFFNELQFTIYGEGKYFYLTEQLKQFGNVKVVNRFISQQEIADLHKSHGIFLCPTRTDAQGVSMCEAMMSGLVPITSDNTAIPEFVTDGVNGYATKSYKEIAERIELLYHNPELYLFLSGRAHASILNKAESGEVIRRELDFVAQKSSIEEKRAA